MTVELRNPPTGQLKLKASLEWLRSDHKDPDAPRRFRMIAYTGAVVQRLFGRAVFSLKGIEHKSRVPILLNHDEGAIVGHADKVFLTDKGLEVLGSISDATEEGRMVAALSDEGFPWEASLGLMVMEWLNLGPGDTRTVNDHELSGPIHVGERSRLAEISFVTAGADAMTEAVALAEDEPAGKKKGQEGAAGNGTKARDGIRQAEERGFTHEEIGAATDRSASIIGQIKSGEIQNPPTDFLEKIRRLVGSGRRGSKPQGDSMSATEKEALKAETDKATRTELGSFLEAFPEDRQSWAAKQFSAGKSLTEAKAALSEVLLTELATAKTAGAASGAAATAEAAAAQATVDELAVKAAAAQAIVDELAAKAGQPGIGFDAKARQDGQQTKPSNLSEKERAELLWEKSSSVKAEFGNSKGAFLMCVKREGIEQFAKEETAV